MRGLVVDFAAQRALVLYGPGGHAQVMAQRADACACKLFPNVFGLSVYTRLLPPDIPFFWVERSGKGGEKEGGNDDKERGGNDEEEEEEAEEGTEVEEEEEEGTVERGHGKCLAVPKVSGGGTCHSCSDAVRD
jgi:hypothetical protein